jgi:phosphatidylserine decarboxylase
MIRLHKEGRNIIIVTILLLLILNLILYFLIPQILFSCFLILSLLFFLFILHFFRNPYRPVPLSKNKILCPADGRVISISRVFEGECLHRETVRISVFMSPLNIHVNRIPLDAVIKYVKYHPGKYLMAFHPKSSELNERNSVLLESEEGRLIFLRQIAGFLARRIVSYVKVNQKVMAGEELGFIKFGSRVDVFLPDDYNIYVKEGQKVYGNITFLAGIE